MSLGLNREALGRNIRQRNENERRSLRGSSYNSSNEEIENVESEEEKQE